MRIVGKLGMGQCLATRLNDVKQLALEFQHENAITQIVEKNKMDWQLFIESATSFKELKQQLVKRGYKGMPMNDKPELINHTNTISKDALQNLPNQRTMMRRGSRST